MELCKNIQNDTTETVNKIDKYMLDEKMRSIEFNTTLGIVRDLDTNKPEAFPLLYQFKKEDITEQINMSKEVASYYKSGKNDPSHIAGLEKMQKQTAQKRRNNQYR